MADIARNILALEGGLTSPEQRQLRGRSLLGLGSGLLRAAGPQPVAPSLGQSMGLGMDTMMDARSKYLQELAASEQIKKMRQPTYQVIGSAATGFKTAAINPFINDEGEWESGIEVKDIMPGVVKAEAPKSYYNIDDESKVISMTATEYAKKPDKEKWIPFTPKIDTETKYAKILTKSDIAKLNELDYRLDPEVVYKVKFTEKTDLNKPIEEIMSEAVDFSSVGGKGQTIYTGDIPEDIMEAAKSEAIKSRSNISTGFDLLTDLERLGPGGTGLRAWFAENVGGVIGQVPVVGGKAEIAFDKLFTGSDPSELKKFRTTAQQYIAQSITRMTGEESGRYTEAEQKITRDALALVNASKSPLQVYGAIVSVIEAEFLAADRNEILANSDNPNWKPKFDLSIKEDYNKLGNMLLGYGLLPQDAEHILTRMDRQRNIKRMF